MFLQQVFELEGIIVLRHFDRQTVSFGVCPVDNHQQIVKHRYDKVVSVCHRMQQLLFYLPQEAHIFRQFFRRGKQVRWRVGLIIIQQAIDEELVGDERAHKVFAKDKKGVVQFRFVHVPFLLLVRRQEEHHIVP